MDKNRLTHFAKGTYTAWRWMVWGLRWLAVGVFSLLLAVGISVKLPWKILVCLAIVPVVGIFVPKKIQPWVWGAMTLVILGAWVWVKLPGSNSAEWGVYQYAAEADGQTGTPLDAAENAAVPYEALFAAYGDDIFHYPVGEQSRHAAFNGPWHEADYPQLAAWIAGYQPALETLTAAAQRPACQFAVPRDLPETSVQMKRLNQMKGWARLLLWAANLDLGEGRKDAALEKQRAVLGMAGHLYQQQMLLDQAAAFDIELLAFRALSTFAIAHGESVEMLAVIEADFDRLDTGWAKSWVTIVDREKLIVKNIMGLFYEVDEAGRTRIAHGAMYALQEGLGYEPRKLFFNQHEMNRLAVIGLWLSLPGSPEGAAAMVDRRFDHYSLLAQKGAALPEVPIQYSWRRGLNVQSVVDWLAVNRVRYFWALHGQFARHQSIVDLVHLFSALKRYQFEHGAWPEDLGRLEAVFAMDAVYGKPFVYQRIGEEFRLYSLGANGVDDGGMNDPAANKDDILFWPRLVRPADTDSLMVRQTAQ